MAVIAVSRWKVNIEQARPVAREIAPLLKAQGATSVRIGACHAGPDAGKVYVAIAFADWASYGRAMQALSADPQYQRIYAEALKIGELVDRSLITAEDL